MIVNNNLKNLCDFFPLIFSKSIKGIQVISNKLGTSS